MRAEAEDGPTERMAARVADERRWSPPQTAMLVVVLSVGLWLLIATTARWLVG